MPIELIEANVARFTSKLKEMKSPDAVIQFQAGMIASLVAALSTKDPAIQQTLLETMDLKEAA